MNKTIKATCTKILLAVIFTFGLKPTVWAGYIIGLGYMSGDIGSWAYGVSADGNVVVGHVKNSDGNYQAFRWTQNNGMAGLGVLPDYNNSFAAGVSADGSVVVGYNTDSNGKNLAFRWTQTDGMIGLGYLPGYNNSRAYGISADGNVVAGSCYKDNIQAFYWTQNGGLVPLGYLPNSNDSWATAVSADGSTIVGNSDFQAVRWSRGGGIVALGNLPNLQLSSAYGVSSDGTVVVGTGFNANNDYPPTFPPQPFINQQSVLWTNAGEMIGLGFLPGLNRSRAYAVSADGSVVVGESDNQAFIWTQKDEMKKFKDVLVANGAYVGHWMSINYAYAISADGKWVVGHGTNADGSREAFLANLSPNDSYFSGAPGTKRDYIGWLDDTRYPWIWHWEHGWWYCCPVTDKAVWFYDLNAGWLYVDNAYYDGGDDTRSWVYSANLGAFIWYYKNAEAPAERSFWNSATNEIIKIPKSQ